MTKKRFVRLTTPYHLFQCRRLPLFVYPMSLWCIHQAAYIFIYPPGSRNHLLFCYNELAEPGDGLRLGRVAYFVVEEGLELRKERVVGGLAVTARAKQGFVALLEVKEFGFVGKFISEGVVEPVLERMGGVAGVIETGDGGLAEHGVGVHVVVSLVDVVHICSLLSANVWKADDFCRIQEIFDLIEVGVLILRIYCDGRAELSHERHLAHCGDPFLDFV